MDIYEQTLNTRNCKIAHLLTNSGKIDQLPFQQFFSYTTFIIYHLHYNVNHRGAEPETAKLPEFPALVCLIPSTKAQLAHDQRAR